VGLDEKTDQWNGGIWQKIGRVEVLDEIKLT
jgi:hypothetical protein